MNSIEELLDMFTVVSYYGYWFVDHYVDGTITIQPRL